MSGNSNGSLESESMEAYGEDADTMLLPSPGGELAESRMDEPKTAYGRAHAPRSRRITHAHALVFSMIDAEVERLLLNLDENVNLTSDRRSR